MEKFRIDQVKEKQQEIKEKVELKKNELEDLKISKRELMESGTEVQASNIDEETKQRIMDLINAGLNEVAEKGDSLSADMNQDLIELDGLKVDTQEALENSYTESEKLQRRKEMLDKIGFGGTLDTSISELQNDQNRLNELNKNLIENQREALDISIQLGRL